MPRVCPLRDTTLLKIRKFKLSKRNRDRIICKFFDFLAALQQRYLRSNSKGGDKTFSVRKLVRKLDHRGP